MKKRVLLTYSLESEDVAEKIPGHLPPLQNIIILSRRLIYGLNPEFYLAVFHVGDADSAIVDTHWVQAPNAFIIPFNRYSEAEAQYPYQKLSYPDFTEEEAKKKAFQIKDRVEGLLE